MIAISRIAPIHDGMPDSPHPRRVSRRNGRPLRPRVPLECCGLLGGVAPVVSSFHPMRNASASEVRYDADPRDLIEAVQSLRARGAEILAIYHSHPRWAAIPSRTDLAENHYGDVPRIIVSLLGETPDVRVWRLDADSYEELPWSITPGSS